MHACVCRFLVHYPKNHKHIQTHTKYKNKTVADAFEALGALADAGETVMDSGLVDVALEEGAGAAAGEATAIAEEAAVGAAEEQAAGLEELMAMSEEELQEEVCVHLFFCFFLLDICIMFIYVYVCVYIYNTCVYI